MEKLNNGQIRVLALGVITREKDGRILATKEFDTKKKQTFYRLIGGGVDFGETAKSALTREFMEELGVEIIIQGAANIQENLFVYEGKQGHEVWFIYGVSFKDRSLYDLDNILFVEDIHKGKSAVWVDPYEPGIVIYPNPKDF